MAFQLTACAHPMEISVVKNKLLIIETYLCAKCSQHSSLRALFTVSG